MTAEAGPRCLVLTRFLPLAVDHGAKQRTAALVRRLVARAEVTVCGFHDGPLGRDASPAMLGVRSLSVGWPTGLADRIAGLGRSRSWSSAKCWSADLARQLRESVRDRPPHVVVLEFPQLAPYLQVVPGVPLVLAWHNVESALTSSYAGLQSRPVGVALRAEAANLRRIERRLVGQAEAVAVAGAADVTRLPPSSQHPLVCPNGVEPAPLPPPASVRAPAGPRAVFIAHMAFPPNADAACWLAREIWPLVARDVPEAELALVGGRPGAIRRLASSTVRVTGAVDDVGPELRAARVALAPLRAGGGTRLKILEALHAGRPVVATPVGAEGLESLAGRGLVIADGATAFAGAVSSLLRDPDQAARLGRLGREAVRDFEWDTTLAPLVLCVLDVARRQQGS